tara:strand:- start:1728 stop:1931 length:204 start_codon:yes stop_codon:yes gene_type:complete
MARTLSTHEQDLIKIRVYGEFMERHGDVYRKDPAEYWARFNRSIEERARQEIIKAERPDSGDNAFVS